FDSSARELAAPADFEKLDHRLRENLVGHVHSRVEKFNGEPVYGHRIQFPDASGDLWTFRSVTYSHYPAISDRGPLVIVSIQPGSGEWSGVRPTDLQADPEVARLIPAIKFMKQEFRNGPTLGVISKTVGLSPFQFHRRFA